MLDLPAFDLPARRIEDARFAPCEDFVCEVDELLGMLVNGYVIPEGYLVCASSDLGMIMPSCLVRQSIPSTVP